MESINRVKVKAKSISSGKAGSTLKLSRLYLSSAGQSPSTVFGNLGVVLKKSKCELDVSGCKIGGIPGSGKSLESLLI